MMATLGTMLATAAGAELKPDDASGLSVPVRAADVAHSVDWTFNFILGVSVFFFVLIVGLTIFFVIRYRHRPGYEAKGGASHSTALELTWTLIPSVLVIVMFYSGFKGYLEMNMPQANSYEISVTGQKWSWEFQYPNGYVDKDLHLPVDQNVQLVLKSKDVIHSLFIPAFRLKKDVVPGRYNKVWFKADKPGVYTIYCAEYCGTAHSDMLANVVVHEPGGFESWLKEASDFLSTLPPAEAGERVYQMRGCTQCHSVTGAAGIGPTLYQSFGREEELDDGTMIVVDENYIRESIIAPRAKSVKGYDRNAMPTYQGTISDEEIDYLIAYIKSLDGQEQESGEEQGQ